MDIQGKLIKILPENRGESARGPWVRGGFVIETDEAYPKQVCFTCFGEDRIQMINGLVMNSPVVVTFAPESREYNDRWYTDLRCIRVVNAAINTPAAQSPMAPTPNATETPVAPAAPFASAPNFGTSGDDSNDDLPF